jgi:hypothetical protein
MVFFSLAFQSKQQTWQESNINPLAFDPVEKVRKCFFMNKEDAGIFIVTALDQKIWN